ncbi:Trimeric GatFAB AmidoTransferase(AdT) complex subunit [Friedmanniomyces endolithicus]|nr:Trimeric GatFAB AmidoTransferase(AdT) complex subunit [Friedmanniomyces endolithicus]
MISLLCFISVFTFSHRREHVQRTPRDEQTRKHGSIARGPLTPTESNDSESLSPARHALQYNLDNSLTLNKKKSWLNIGGTIRKSALSIKGALDYVRGEQPKPQDDDDAKRVSSESADSQGSTMAVFADTPKTERRSTFTPHHAVASLRQHFSRHSKRGSTNSIFRDKDATSEASPEGPERFSTDSHDNKEVATPSRRTSIADSIVGSVRGFGRKVSLKKAALPGELQSQQRRSPERSAAAAVPLPSSPINIPNAPPALSLNLGPAGFISPSFSGSPGAGHEEEHMYLTAIMATGKPETRVLYMPAELEGKATKACPLQQHSTPVDMLHLQMDDLEFDPVMCPARRDELSTPMPGTDFPLELDGTSDSPPFFERHVEPAECSPTRSGLGLRQMRSIDALAQSQKHVRPALYPNDSTEALANAAVIAHAADEAESAARMASVDHSDATAPALPVLKDLNSTAGTSTMATDATLPSIESSHAPAMPVDQSMESDPLPAPLFMPMDAFPGERRDLDSTTTIATCPRDMASLSRQSSPSPVDVDHGDIERWKQCHQYPRLDDKCVKQEDERRDSVMEIGPVADSGRPFPNSGVDLPYRFKAATGISELSRTIPSTPPPQLTCRMVEPSPSTCGRPDEQEQSLPVSNTCRDPGSVITDYDEFKTQHLFCNEEEGLSLPDYDNATCVSSPDGSPIMPLRLTQLYEAATGPPRNPSPTNSSHGVVLRSTDVGSIFWKFSVNNWLGDDAADATEASLDDNESDTTEKDTSPVCPSSADAHRTPSMGSRLDFELQRSERNMRYNALQAKTSGHVAEDSTRRESSTWTFCLQESIEEIELPLSDPDYHFATEPADRAKENRNDCPDAGSTTSGGSTRHTLESAVRDTNYAEAMLTPSHEKNHTHHHDSANPPDGVQTSSPLRLTEWERQALQSAIPSQAYDTHQSPIRATRSPKRVTHAEIILPSTFSSSPTGGITVGGFSPTASLLEVSSNRFAALDVDMPSSPPEPVGRYESDGRAPGGCKFASQAMRQEFVKPGDVLFNFNSPGRGHDVDSSASAKGVEASPPGTTLHQQNELNAVIHNGSAKDPSLSGALSGRTIAIKDNIATKDSPTTAASKALTGYTSPFDATVIKLLRQNGATISAKTNLDEFGMGSHSQHSHAGPVLSQHSRSGVPLSPGGSSGGSAVAVATGQCWAALGTDTGGSVRLPAAFMGTVGFKPSFGVVSRWGVIQYANSMDTVGILAGKVEDARRVFGCLDVFDGKDPTSLSASVRKRAARRPSLTKGLRIGVPLEYNIAGLAPAVRSAYMRTLGLMQDHGHSLHPVSLPTTRQALSAYYVLAPAEASSNLAKYDGIRYGYRTQGPDASPKSGLPLYARTRGEGFGEEVKRRILLGAYTLSSEAIDNYFIQAQKVRRLVQRDFDGVFTQLNPLLNSDTTTGSGVRDEQGVDVLLTPTAPTLPPTVEEVKRQSSVESYMNDVFTVPASLAGLPAISVPVKLSGGGDEMVEETDVQSVGVQFIGQFGDDQLVLQAAGILEQLECEV